MPKFIRSHGIYYREGVLQNGRQRALSEVLLQYKNREGGGVDLNVLYVKSATLFSSYIQYKRESDSI